MRVACCFSQMKNGVYASQWQQFINQKFNNVDIFLHHFNPYMPVIPEAQTISSDLAQNVPFRGMMCSSHIKKGKELDDLIVYDIVIYANLDAPIPHFNNDFMDNIVTDHLYLLVNQGPFLPDPGDLPEPNINFMFGDSVTMSVASEFPNFKGMWKERYNTIGKEYYCYLQATYTETVDIRYD